MAFYSATLGEDFDRTGSISPIATLTVSVNGDDTKYDASVQDPYNSSNGANVIQISAEGLDSAYTLPASIVVGYNTDDGRQEKTYEVTDLQPA